MALRQPQTPTIAGVTPTYHPAAAGDQVPADDRTTILVRNASAGAVTATVVTPGVLATGPYPDLTVSVPAGGERLIGPFSRSIFGNADGAADITWSATASVTYAVLSL